MNLQISVNKHKDYIIFKLSGSLVASTNSILEKAVNQQLEDENYNLIFDLENIKYIDSAGFGTIAISYKKAEKNGSVKLLALSNNLRRIFEITGLTRLIPVLNSIDDL